MPTAPPPKARSISCRAASKTLRVDAGRRIRRDVDADPVRGADAGVLFALQTVDLSAVIQGIGGANRRGTAAIGVTRARSAEHGVGITWRLDAAAGAAGARFAGCARFARRAAGRAARATRATTAGDWETAGANQLLTGVARIFVFAAERQGAERQQQERQACRSAQISPGKFHDLLLHGPLSFPPLILATIFTLPLTSLRRT